MTKSDKVNRHVETLLNHGIGQTEGLSDGNSLFMVFTQPPMPLFCLQANSEMPTTEELLFIRIYQEFMVANAGYCSGTVERRRNVPFIPGANTEIWSKGGWHEDGKWRYHKASWTMGGFSPQDGCETPMELANHVDWSRWKGGFSEELAILFPLLLILNESWELDFQIDNVKDEVRSRNGGEYRRLSFQTFVGNKKILVRIHLSQIIVAWEENPIDEIKTDPESIEMRRVKVFDILSPDCYDDILLFVKNLHDSD